MRTTTRTTTRPAARPATARSVRPAAALTAAALALTLTGCAGVQDLPLPGGADLGDRPYTVTATFANVLNLVPQSAVKVNDVAVGRVTKVSLPPGGWTAEVTMLVNRRIRLPAGSYAHLRQSSLLGEKYIALTAPPGTATATTAAASLGDGARIPQERTNRNPEVEEVLGALSLLLNGGGIAQLRTITTELNNALRGNEPQIRSLLERLATLTGSLDANKKGITDALDGLNRLSATLRGRREQIATVLDDLAPGLKTLEEQRGALVRMLTSLDALSKVAVRTVEQSRADMVADLHALEPVLRKLADAGRDLPRSLQALVTFPFTDAVLPAIKGDYLNVYLRTTAVPGIEVIPPITPPPTTGPPAKTPAKTPATQQSAPPLPLPSTGDAGPAGEGT
ncbi:MCE family protein [Actinomadura hibisca]|uniref:MCE family protein n=1 Tax=Actinomadura hibisca TaxID=68565 RepID=UPI00082C16CD|nr:MCE family protein [Actinomadura hibisca]